MVAPVRPWLKPLGQVFAAGARARSWLYDQGWRGVWELDCPVVSIGNLTVGGTGKTPLVAEILRWCQGHQIRVGVISRGYGRRGRQVAVVEDGHVAEFGDEPSMLHRRFPEVPIVVGADRLAAGEHLLERFPVDLILADDAFQHRRLHRDLDVVVLDAVQPGPAYFPLPWGLAREPLSALSRAQAVVVTRLDLATPADRIRLDGWRRQHSPPGCVWAGTGLRLRGVATLRGGREVPAEELKEVFVISALGRPEAFRSWLEKHLSLRVVSQVDYGDHHAYTPVDLQSLAERGFAERWILVTEKDAVKLRELEHPLLNQIAVVSVDLEWVQGEQEFFNLVLRQLR